MKKKTRASMKTPTSTSTVTKRRLIDEDDIDLDAELVDVESSDEQSGVRKVEKSGKKARMSVEEKTEGQGFEDRKIILGKPLYGKAFFNCGVVKLFSDLGFESFLVDLPKICYPTLVREFYANLQPNASGQYVSYVNNTKIQLSAMFFNAIVFTPPSPVQIHTKRGFKQFDDFSVNDQFNVLFGVDGPVDTFPSTIQILPLAHAVFKVSIKNLSPRLGTRSNLSAQDVIIVSMILAGKKFDMGDLVMNNMIAAIEGKTNAGLPYGLLLTRIFEWYGVNFVGAETLSAKEFLDVKCLSHSNLKVEKDGSLSVIEVLVAPSSSVPVDLGIPAKEILDFMDELRENHKQLVDGQKQLSEQIHEISNQLKFWKEFFLGAKFGDTPEMDTSGNTSGGMSLLNELYKFKQFYGSGGSSEIKFSAGTEDTPAKGSEMKIATVDVAVSDPLTMDLEALQAKIAEKLQDDKEDAVDDDES